MFEKNANVQGSDPHFGFLRRLNCSKRVNAEMWTKSWRSSLNGALRQKAEPFLLRQRSSRMPRPGSEGQAVAFEWPSRPLFTLLGDGFLTPWRNRNNKKMINMQANMSIPIWKSRRGYFEGIWGCLSVSEAPGFPSAPPVREVDRRCNYICPSSLLCVLTVPLMSPTLQLHLLGVLFHLFSPLHYSGVKFSASRSPFAPLTVAPFVTLSPYEDKSVDRFYLSLAAYSLCTSVLRVSFRIWKINSMYLKLSLLHFQNTRRFLLKMTPVMDRMWHFTQRQWHEYERRRAADEWAAIFPDCWLAVQKASEVSLKGFWGNMARSSWMVIYERIWFPFSDDL